MIVALWLHPKDFRAGDLIFLSSKEEAYRIDILTYKAAVGCKFCNNKKEIWECNNIDQFFSPISFSVARKI